MDKKKTILQHLKNIVTIKRNTYYTTRHYIKLNNSPCNVLNNLLSDVIHVSGQIGLFPLFIKRV